MFLLSWRESKVTGPLPSESSQSREKQVREGHPWQCVLMMVEKRPPRGRRRNGRCGFSPVRKPGGWKEGGACGVLKNAWDLDVQRGISSQSAWRWENIPHRRTGPRRRLGAWLSREDVWRDWSRSVGGCSLGCQRDFLVGAKAGDTCALWGLGFCVAASAWMDKNLFLCSKIGSRQTFPVKDQIVNMLGLLNLFWKDCFIHCQLWNTDSSWRGSLCISWSLLQAGLSVLSRIPPPPPPERAPRTGLPLRFRIRRVLGGAVGVL